MKTVSMLIFALLGASGVSASQIRAVNTEIVDLDPRYPPQSHKTVENIVDLDMRPEAVSFAFGTISCG